VELCGGAWGRACVGRISYVLDAPGFIVTVAVREGREDEAVWSMGMAWRRCRVRDGPNRELVSFGSGDGTPVH
jgi:hypothetical protein